MYFRCIKRLNLGPSTAVFIVSLFQNVYTTQEDEDTASIHRNYPQTHTHQGTILNLADLGQILPALLPKFGTNRYWGSHGPAI